MNDLCVRYDYSKLSVKKLLYFLRNIDIYHVPHRESVTDAKSRIFSVLVNKYFEDKSVVNIYDVLQDINPFYVKSEAGFKFVLSVLVRETSDTREIPKEYQKDFILFVNSFLKQVDSLSKDSNFTFEVEWSSFSKILDALSNLTKKDTDSEYQRMGINLLIKRIKDDIKKEQLKRENSVSLIPNNDSLVLQDNLSKIENLSEFKLVKSKLTKSVLESILPNFKHYSDKDKVYLVNYIKKKGYSYLGHDIPNVDGFYYFSNHIDLVDSDKYFNPFCYFYNWCLNTNRISFKMGSDGVSNIFKDWYAYYNIKDFKSLFALVKDFYMSIPNSSEKGCQSYLYECAKSLVCLSAYYNYPELCLLDVLNEYVFPSIYSVINQFTSFKGCSLLEFSNEKSIDFGYKMGRRPYIQNNELFEDYFQSIENDKVFILYSKYNDTLLRVFNCICPLYTEDGFEFIDFKLPGKVQGYLYDFYSIPGNINLTVSDIKSIECTRDIGYVFRSYFCKHYVSFSKSLATSLFNDKDALGILSSCYWGSGSGLMCSYSEIWKVLYDTISSDLDYSSEKDLRSILVHDYYTVIRCIIDIFENLSKYYSDLNLLVEDYFNVTLNEASRHTEYCKLVYDFVRVYFDT